MSGPGTSDLARFKTAYTENHQAVLAYLLRRTDAPEDAADLLAEVYLVAWRRIKDLPDSEQSRPWLFGVARRLLANQRRRAQTRSGLADALEASLRHVELESAPDGDSSTGHVRQALAQLSPLDRELVTLSAWEGLTPAEIAAVLGQPPSRVRVQLHRARRRLKEKLDAPNPRPVAHHLSRRPVPAASRHSDTHS
jgi:RNA polymerase sigma factor (sigma-70 family)